MVVSQVSLKESCNVIQCAMLWLKMLQFNQNLLISHAPIHQNSPPSRCCPRSRWCQEEHRRWAASKWNLTQENTGNVKLTDSLKQLFVASPAHMLRLHWLNVEDVTPTDNKTSQQGDAEGDSKRNGLNATLVRRVNFSTCHFREHVSHAETNGEGKQQSQLSFNKYIHRNQSGWRWIITITK